MERVKTPAIFLDGINVESLVMSPSDAAEFRKSSVLHNLFDEDTGAIVSCFRRNDGSILIDSISWLTDDRHPPHLPDFYRGSAVRTGKANAASEPRR